MEKINMYALLVWMMYYCMLDNLDLLFYGQMPTILYRGVDKFVQLFGNVH